MHDDDSTSLYEIPVDITHLDMADFLGEGKVDHMAVDETIQKN